MLHNKLHTCQPATSNVTYRVTPQNRVHMSQCQNRGRQVIKQPLLINRAKFRTAGGQGRSQGYWRVLYEINSEDLEYS